MVGLFTAWLRAGLAVSVCILPLADTPEGHCSPDGPRGAQHLEEKCPCAPYPPWHLNMAPRGCPLCQPSSLAPVSSQWGSTQLWGETTWLRAHRGAEVRWPEGASSQPALSSGGSPGLVGGGLLALGSWLPVS